MFIVGLNIFYLYTLYIEQHIKTYNNIQYTNGIQKKVFRLILICIPVIIFHFEGMSFSSAHDLKQWDFLDNNEISSEFAQFIRQHILTILTIKQLVVKRPSLTRCAQT